MKKFMDKKMNLVFKDFKESINGLDYYCQLKQCRFDGKNTPEYSEEIIQQYYLLRFLPAYLAEYYLIYKKLIDTKFLGEDYNILSIGCGCGLDLWGAKFAKDSSKKTMKIRYTGLDIIDWKYQDAVGTEAYFLEEDINTLEQLDEDGYNIIIFPKSIGEFSVESFNRLKRAIEETDFSSDKIVLLSSIRNTRHEYDINRIKRIVTIFKNTHNYSAKGDIEKCRYYPNQPNGWGQPLSNMVSGFYYPEKIKDQLIELFLNCQGYKEECEDWKKECKDIFSRKPITTMSQAHHQIITLER